MVTTKIVFDHRGRVKKGAEGPLEVRVTIDRRPYYINTGIHVRRNEWKYDAVVDRPDEKELNERLVILIRRVEKEINACLDAGKPIDVAEVRRKVTSVNCVLDGGTEFLDWCDVTVDKLVLAEGTKKHYRTLCGRLRQFDKLRSWEDVNTEKILEFDVWLHELGADGAERSLSVAGIYTYHKCLKALLNRADSIGKIERNPYDRLKGKIKRGEKENVEYLTEDEMMAIRKLRLEDGSVLEKARDIFVFQMYTGMAYSDAMNFSIANYRYVDGEWICNQERIKTGVAYVSQLLPPVVEVLAKYGMQLPRLDAADYNHALKLIGSAAGIRTHMHSHLARHTFATYMLRNGVKIENLQKMLGHNSIVTTQRYAKVLASAVHDDFSMISEKLKKC